jgi:Arm DNA-binding domain
VLKDTALRNLQPRAKPYKVTDRDGMYIAVSAAGTVTFRYDYRLNGLRETPTIGRYSRDGISLAVARERLSDAKRAVNAGRSPAIEKQREKRRMAQAKTFGEFAVRWLKDARMADTTRSMRKSILDRDIAPAFESRLMCEVSADDLRALCQKLTSSPV